MGLNEPADIFLRWNREFSYEQRVRIAYECGFPAQLRDLTSMGWQALNERYPKQCKKLKKRIQRDAPRNG